MKRFSTHWPVLPLLLILSLGVGTPTVNVSASEEDLDSEDAVERAGASLSRTLASLQAQQSELAQLNAVAIQRNQVIASLASPRFQEAPLGFRSLAWLRSRNDPAVTGILPIAGRQGLVVSYDIPTDDPLAFLRGRSFTYDNAVAAVALLLQGRPHPARRILLALERQMTPEGTLGFSYQIDSDFVDTTVRTGTLAWVGYAFALYQRLTGNRRFLSSAIGIAEYLKTLQAPSGSLKGGPDVQWISTEHNLDAHAFYALLALVTGNRSYRSMARRLKRSLLTNHWVGGENPHFQQGIGDDTPALDVNTLGALFLKSVGRPGMAREAMRYAELIFRTEKTIPASTVRFSGYAPYSGRGTIWLEGTLQAAIAYHRLGMGGSQRTILNNVKRLQNTLISQGIWSGGLPYAIPRWVDSGGDTFLDLPSTASTSWLLIMLALRNGESRFWDLQ